MMFQAMVFSFQIAVLKIFLSATAMITNVFSRKSDISLFHNINKRLDDYRFVSIGKGIGYGVSGNVEVVKD